MQKPVTTTTGLNTNTYPFLTGRYSAAQIYAHYIRTYFAYTRM